MIDELTAFQRDIMYIIAGHEKPHGLEIKDVIDEYRGTTHNGRLYPNLDRLANKGLVHKGEKDKRTNFYELTEKGKKALVQREEWTDKHFNINPKAITS